MSQIPLYVVDAFTSDPFRGNPASVCLLDRELAESEMQTIAAEMNHSETAFVRPLDGTALTATRFALRWFTPKVEVPLCGHATLASAAVVFREVGNRASSIAFETKSGTLTARVDQRHIALDFPAIEVRPTPPNRDVLNALGLSPQAATFAAVSGRNLLIHVATEADVRGVDANPEQLRRARGNDTFLGIIVTAAGSSPYDFVSRYFAPWVGIDEDPVTGSAHCALAPYWAALTGKTDMRAYQASQRGGEMTVRVGSGRVQMVGDAVVVASGQLRLR